MLLLFLLSTTVLAQTPSKGDERKECAEDFNNICKFHAGDVWVGKYGKTNTDVSLSENEVTFTFAPNNYVIETNRLGTNWNRFVLTDNYLAVQQFASFPERVARDCAPDVVAKYSIKWSADCKTAEIYGIKETCRRREALYNTMQFTLQAARPVDGDTSSCDWSEGTGIWQAKYNARVNSLTAADELGTFTFAAANGAVVETGSEAVYFYRFHAVAPGKFVVADYGSQDFQQRCTLLTKPTLTQRKPVPIESPYTVAFGNKCTVATLNTVDDACVDRRRRLNTLELFRVPIAGSNHTVVETPAQRAAACSTACNTRLSDKVDIYNCVLRCQAMR